MKYIQTKRIHFYLFFKVSLEFNLKYESSHVDPNGLIDNWNVYADKLLRVLTQNHKKKPFKTRWSAEIEKFLHLIQLFPSKQVGRNVTASSSNFEAASKKLIQLESVFKRFFSVSNQFLTHFALQAYTPFDAMAPQSTSFPIIVACGEAEDDIVSYCLKVEGKIITVRSAVFCTKIV